jgi:ethanolamine ammonia-lyase small subunit
MLGYLTTSFREHPALRHRTGRAATEAMRHRLEALGVPAGAAPATIADTAARLSARYARAGGDHRTEAALEADARRELVALQERGWDLGLADADRADARVDALYEHARAALYSTIDDGVTRDTAANPRPVRTAAMSRDEYLGTPSSGERLRDEDARLLEVLYPARRPQVQLVISDGLNANAVNEQLRAVLPGMRRALVQAGHHVGEHDVVVRNGRVRAGYDVGLRTGAEIVVHLIGERPGTGLNTLSAYVTYGRDPAGAWRWSPDLPHSATTAVCGIHPRGKPPVAAVDEIVRVVGRAVTQRRSGVALDARA